MDVNVRNEEDLLHFATGLSNLSQALVSSFSKANNEMNRVNEGGMTSKTKGLWHI